MNKIVKNIFKNYYNNFDYSIIAKNSIDIIRSIYNNVIFVPQYSLYIYDNKIVIKNYKIDDPLINIDFVNIFDRINKLKILLYDFNIDVFYELQ